MLNKHKLYSIALISAAIILMLTSIAGAAPFAYITNSGSNSVSVIDTATNTVTTSISVGNNPWGAAISPDGTKVYIANLNDDNVSVIDPITNIITANVSVGQNAGPVGVAVTPDGKKLYVTSSDGTTGAGAVNVINTTTNTIASTVNVGNIPIGISVTPDGTQVYVENSASNNVSVIDTATTSIITTVNVGKTPQALGQFIGKTAPTITWNQPANITSGTALSSAQLDASASVPGTFVYTPSLGTILNLGTQTLNTTFTPNDTANYTTVSKNISINVTSGPLAYIPTQSNVSIIDTATNTVMGIVNVNAPGPGVAISPDGKKVYVVTEASSPIPGNVSVVDTTTNTVTAKVSVGLEPYGLAVTPNGKNVYVTNLGSNNVSVINTTTNNVTATVNLSFVNSGYPNPFGVAITPDGTKAYITNSGCTYSGYGAVCVINTAINQVMATVNGLNQPWGVAVTPDGANVYVASSVDGTVSVINTTNNTIAATVTLPEYNDLDGVAVSPNGNKVYVTASNGTTGTGAIYIIDTANNTIAVTVPVWGYPNGVAVTPDGNKVYALDVNNNIIYVIDTATNQVRTVSANGGPFAIGQFISSVPMTPTLTWNNPANII